MAVRPFAHQVHQWRRHRKLSQQEFGQKAGLPRSMISALEQGVHEPTLGTLRKLCVALGVSIGELIEGSPPTKKLSRMDLDGLVRGALGLPGGKGPKEDVRRLKRLLAWRRKLLSGKDTQDASVNPKYTEKLLKAQWGERRFRAMVRRAEKLTASALK